MAQYTVLKPGELRNILAQYAIGDIISHQLLSGGSENTNYLITTAAESCVLTVCERKSAQKAKELALLLEYLALHNFSTSKLIRNTADEVVTSWNNKSILLKKFIHGRISKELPGDLLMLIGKELGKLHKIKAPEYLQATISYGMEYFEEVAIYDPGSSFYHWLQDVKKRVKKHLSFDLPKTLIHGDLFYSNVIIDENNEIVTIMDFEEAGYYYRVFDVGMAIVGLCGEEETINLEKVGCFLEGYQQEIPLSATELNSLKDFAVYAAAGMAFWRHQHFRYLQPEKAMYDHYKTMKNIADHIAQLPDDCFKL